MVKRPSLAQSMKSVQQSPMRVIADTAAAGAPHPTGGARGYFAATRAGMKRVTAVVDPMEHRKLKRLSADTGRSIEDLMREALTDLFAKQGI